MLLVREPEAHVVHSDFGTIEIEALKDVDLRETMSRARFEELNVDLPQDDGARCAGALARHHARPITARAGSTRRLVAFDSQVLKDV